MVSTVTTKLLTPSKLTRSVSGTPVGQVRRLRAARVNTALRASLDESNIKMTSAAVAAAILATPLAAQAIEATASVDALLGSVVNGGIVGGLIVGTILLVSGFDPVNRGR